MKKEELDNLSDEELFKLLDEKAAENQGKVRKLNTHEMKKFASFASKIEGRELTDEELNDIRKEGKRNENTNNQNWIKRNT